MFSFSNYFAKSKYHNELNALVVGKMKDEMGGIAIKEFVRLRPKIYSILAEISKEYRKSKVAN